MDVIINLIIVLVIIASFMKRFQEASQKGREVNRPIAGRDKAPEPATVPRAEIQDIPPEPPPVAAPEVPTRPRTLEDLVEQLERGYREAFEPKPPPKPEPVYEVTIPSSEDTFEATTEPEMQPLTEARLTLAAPKHATVTESDAVTSFAFSSSPLVNGLIMGEILGPPVSLRTGMDPHRLV